MNDKTPLKTWRNLIGIFNGIEYSVQLEMKNEDIIINLYREGELVASKNLHDADLSVWCAHTELVGWIAEKINMPSLDPYDLRYSIFSTVLSVIRSFQHERVSRAIKEDVMKDKEYMKFKLGMGQLANEAIEIIKRIRELQKEFEKLMERKRAGEVVKDLLKQNKVELKQLKKREFKTYSESKKEIRIEKARQKVLQRQEVLQQQRYWSPALTGQKSEKYQKFKKFKPIDLLLYLNKNTSEEDQRILYIRILDLADKLRLKRLKICVVVILILVLPMIILFLII